MNSPLQRIAGSPPGGALIDRLSRADIAELTSRSTFKSGERDYSRGWVLDCDVEKGGRRISGMVRSKGWQLLSVSIDIAEVSRNLLGIESECSCSVQFNCRHVAAMLFQAIADNEAFRRAPQAVPGTVPAKRARASDTLELFPELKPVRAPVVPPPEMLDPMLANWIESLARLEESETEDYPPDIQRRLIYVLDVAPRSAGAPHLVARPVSVRLLKDGSFADKTSDYNPESVLQSSPAKFLRPSDRDILKRLHAMKGLVPVPAGTAFVGEGAAGVLTAMIATGRARWGAVAGPAITQGPERTGRLAWRLADDGSQYPDFELDGATPARVLRLTAPWYVETDTAAGPAVLGPVITGFAPRIAAGILSAPSVPARQSRLLRAAMTRRLPALGLVEPPELEPPQRIEVPPVPCLQLMVRELPREHYYGFGPMPKTDSPDAERVFVARLYFRYESVKISIEDARDCPTFARGGRIVEVVRDRIAEHKAVIELFDLGFEKLTDLHPYGVPAEFRTDFAVADESDGAEWIDVIYHDVPALRATGWEIDIAADFPVHLVRADGEVSAEFRDSTGIDWFELDLGVLVDGQRIDLVPAILKAVASPTFDARAMSDTSEGELPIYLPLGDGRILAMPAARLRPILSTLHELFTAGSIDAKAKRLGFSLRDAASITDFEAATRAAGMVWRGGEQLRELGRMLRETGTIPSVELPPGFTATLRPYQARGVDWLQFLRAAGLGGVLADDMGLGKTVQALAYLAIEKASGRMDCPALVVAPTSVLGNWRREAERFVPDMKVLTLHGLDRKSHFGEIASHDLVLTTYPLLARDHAALKAQSWHVLVLDEAQVIKNPDAATTQLVFGLQSRHRVCLTGTPLENHLGEVWSLFAFLSPGFLGDQLSFKRNWRTPIEKQGNADRRRLLARRVRPFLLRRTKAEVATELPPKTEIIEPVEMEQAQRNIYESIRLSMHSRVREAIAAKGLARSRIVVLDALLKLRQTCCDPRLLKLAYAASGKARSAKLDRLMEMLPELIDEGRRVLLFSQFTSMLALVEEALKAASIRYVLLTGDTRDRETPIRQFQAGEVPLFLISLKAGGLGLNLTAADTVIHYDPWWNPAVEDQATDRAHRIGQDKPVFVHKLVMLGSIEEKIEALKTHKRNLAAGLFNSDAGSALDLTEADIDDLFSLG